LIVAAVLSESDNGGHPSSPPARPTSTLLIICDRGRNVSQACGKDTADIYSHFHRRCDTQNIDTTVIRILTTYEDILETKFKSPCHGFLDLGTVLKDFQRKRIRVTAAWCRRFDQATVVIPNFSYRTNHGVMAAAQANLQDGLIADIGASATYVDALLQNLELKAIDVDAEAHSGARRNNNLQ